MGERVILTAAPESEALALADLQRAIDCGLGIRRRTAFQSAIRNRQPAIENTALAPGVLLLELPGTFTELVAAFREQPPLFIRHVQPVQIEVPLAGEAADLEGLAAAARELAPRLQPEQSFSVQSRLFTDARLPYGRFEVNERLAALLRERSGAAVDVRAPEQILSVAVMPATAYLGLSRAADNLSAWAGGAMRFAREPEQVSRSEFKLLEALAVFGLTLPSQGLALDLGAAPGGWTRLLRRAGLLVTAVDPGDLDARVAADPGIRHLRIPVQEYQCRRGEFSVIVNDLRMDARDSAHVMLNVATRLTEGGLALMTVKLPSTRGAGTRSPEPAAHEAIDLLRRRYTLLGARQLFHNRSEITVALRRGEPAAS
jgi:23S rRNA (cytidine2498-2'-O)-methyltransferase